MVQRQRLCHLDTLPDPGSKGFSVNGENVFLIKQHGKVYLYRNQCPHIGIALEWVEDQFLDASHTMIQCANHGALFVIENGECVAGPCSGKALIALPFDIVDGYVELIAERVTDQEH
ncbi:Rieske 2Fe-2S domain-containing protein [Cellvibrio sp. PSBB006]|uniref:Rieske (2Fe-2S) protein n=1 Tax=Cellvibrio sp. PSBB006 TaxID=1987723 RepID=UPI000B3B4DAC|nr:Rieske 2Fe-2S domain-containing protein [Cellvibrio sp. PSBB006]ARU27672.1 (2Fe-2S)-binding protein [Cellvibrio sp. PSBB006]